MKNKIFYPPPSLKTDFHTIINSQNYLQYIQFMSINEYQNLLYYILQQYKKTSDKQLLRIFFTIFSFNASTEVYSYFIELLKIMMQQYPSHSNEINNFATIIKEKHMYFDLNQKYTIDTTTSMSFDFLQQFCDIYTLLHDGTEFIYEDRGIDYSNDLDKQFSFINTNLLYITKVLWARTRLYFYDKKYSLHEIIELLTFTRDLITHYKKAIQNKEVLPMAISLRLNSIISAFNNINIKLQIDIFKKNIEESLEVYKNDVEFIHHHLIQYQSIRSVDRFVQNILELQNYYNFLKLNKSMFSLYLNSMHVVQQKLVRTFSHVAYLDVKQTLTFDDVYKYIEHGTNMIGAAFFIKQYGVPYKNSEKWEKTTNSIKYLHDIWTFSPNSMEEKSFDFFYPDYIWK